MNPTENPVSRPAYMKDDDKVVVDGKTYWFNHYYNRLSRAEEEDKSCSIMCPKCHGTQFEIGYGPPGSYECIARCPCGHTMTVYDG